MTFVSCDNNNKSYKEKNSVALRQTNDSTENFDEFNVRFHTDSLFQLSRISFPIGGHFADANDSYKWTPENWVLMRVPVKEKVQSNIYQHELHKTDTSVTERFWIDNSGFDVERRFKKISDK